MNKKITRLYLSLLVFLLSFFAIYSQRFVVYDSLNAHFNYSDTLSKEEIKEAKAYLDEQEQVDFINHTQIRKDLNQLLKKEVIKSFYIKQIQINPMIKSLILYLHFVVVPH